MSGPASSRADVTRTRLLDATESVLLTSGADAVTLDAVAAAAGVSKGGLLYHYPTKEALVIALVKRTVGAVDALLAEAATSTAPGAFTRAYVDTCLGENTPPDSTDALSAALIGVSTIDPALIEPLRDAFRRWQQRLEADGIDPAAATVIRLAVDGWWVAGVLDLSRPTVGPQAVRRYLLGLLPAGS